MEESMAVPQKTKCEINIYYSKFTSGNVLKLKHKLELFVHRVHSSIMYNNKMAETTQMSTNR